jgi:hypothetical protein
VTVIRCIVADSQTGLIYDLSNAMTSAIFDTNMLAQPGKLTIALSDSRLVDFSHGSAVSLMVDDHRMFNGYVFTITKRPNSSEVICYDKIRYLGSKDSLVMSSTSIKKVCDQVKESTGIEISVTGGETSLGKKVFDNQSYYQMIQWSLDEDLKKSNEMHIVRDEYGDLKVLDVSTLMHPIVIGDGSLLTDWEFSSSIDESTYTTVKLVRDRSKRKKIRRSTVVVQDSESVRKWGKLQYFERIDDKTTDSAMRQMAYDLLKLYSAPTQTMSLIAIGHPPLKAGDGAGILIGDLDNEGFAKARAAFCSSVRHVITPESHTMELEVAL